MDDDTRRILVADSIAEEGKALLRAAGEVDVRTGLSESELIAIIPAYDALVVRSATQVTRPIIEAGARLLVIGRAGVGVNNIDLQAATERGITVVNAPQGNTIAAAEHTIALLMALARHIPQAHASLRQGEWRRNDFVGVEIRGKTLGIFGLGNIGAAVARRARGMEMHVLGSDPFVSPDHAQTLGVELVGFDALIAESDFITVHVPLTPDTHDCIGPAEFGRMKDGVRLINAARGGIINEQALAAAVRSGKVAGAAIDVFTTEPPGESNPLTHEPRIIVTPHLGASTAEAQEQVALDVAEQIVEIFAGLPARYAVNAPLLPPETLAVVGPYMEVAERVASMAMQLAEGQLARIEIGYYGEIALHDITPLRAAVIKGLMRPISEENVTLVNANFIAQSRGWHIAEHKVDSHEAFSNLVHVRLVTSGGEVTVGGIIEHGQAHVVLINGLDVDITAAPGTVVLVCQNHDRPGMIGRIGTRLGEFDINISAMQVGRRERRDGLALMLLQVDEAPSEEQVDDIVSIDGIIACRLLRL
jgi:D-3-phosphoglycerate dehydrogenase